MSQKKGLWCLVKVGKHASFKLAEVNYIDFDTARVSEHWFGELSYTISKEDIFIMGTKQECTKYLKIYENFVDYQQKRFNGVLMIL